jgi:Ala-tRNA(Pro) deacylase
MPLQQFLDIHGFAFECHEHPAVMTVAESEALVPHLPGAKTKNLFLRDKKGDLEIHRVHCTESKNP